METDEEYGIKAVFKLFTDVGHKLNKHTDAVLGYTTRLKRPSLIPITNITQVNSAGYAVIDLGGPPALYMWIVRLITVSDALAWTNSMGTPTVQFGVGNIPPEAGAGIAPMAPNTVRWPFNTLPNAATFSTNHFTLYHGDRLYCQLQGGVANENVQATAVIEQWLVSAMRQDADIA
jgi:hypothetical protein